MKFDIIHELPGRMRVRCRLVRLNPEYRLELDRWVSCHDGLLSAAFSARTGSLLVVYSRAMPRDSLLTMLDGLQLFGAATMAERHAGRRDAAANIAIRACRKETVSAITKALLPKPLFQLLGVWKAGVGIVGMFRALFQGDMAEFCWRTVRFAVMAICGNLLIVRLLLIGVLDAVGTSCDPVMTRYRGGPGSARGALSYEDRSQRLLPAPAIGGVAI